MGLVDKQHFFAQCVARLLQEAAARGYQTTLGEAWRPDATAAYYASIGKGIKNSLHGKRLALDLELFKDGALLTQTADYEALGVWWEAQSTPDFTCCWGGRFKDGNHFSVEHEGVK